MANEAGSGSAKGGSLLGVFARYWTPGQVKTRLAASIGHDAAASLHRQFVTTTLARLAGIADQQWLAMTPSGKISRMAEMGDAARGWTVIAQGGGDLGQRMQKFFDAGLLAADRVVLVGSDSPDLPRRWIAEAFAELARVPVVLGPSVDGGYYLLGMAAKLLSALDLAFLFEAIAWSTPQVLPMTLARLASRGIDCHLLPPWRDVDEWPDLVELHTRLTACDARYDESLRELRAAVGQVVAAHSSEPK